MSFKIFVFIRNVLCVHVHLQTICTFSIRSTYVVLTLILSKYMYLQQDIKTEIGITDLKEQLERSKQHVTEYQTMADNLQKALSEQSEVQ